MEIKTFKEFLYDLSLNMDETDKVDLMRKLYNLSSNMDNSDKVNPMRKYSDYIFYNNEDEIREIFGENAHGKILDAISEGQYNPDDEYFIIDEYGDIKTFDNIDDNYDIFELMECNSAEYLDYYKDYLSDILDNIDNFKDLHEFKGVTLIEDLIDDFIEDIDKKTLTIGDVYRKQ